MKTFEFDGTVFEVEEQKMGTDTLDVAFLDESDFGVLYNWVSNADLSYIEMVGEEGEITVYEGYSVFKSLVFLQATDQDFWEGLRAIVTLSKPIEPEK